MKKDLFKISIDIWTVNDDEKNENHMPGPSSGKKES